MAPLLVRHGLYPLLALSTLAYLAFELTRPAPQLGNAYPLYLAGIVLVMLAAEWRWPLRAEWRMTGRLLLRRDLPFMALGGATIAGVNAAGAAVVLHHGLQRPALLAGWPLLPAMLLTLLVGDGLWYAVHRACHEARGPLGRWLWRVHVAHHLPAQVYVMMHPVGHPLSGAIVRVLLALPPWLLGVPGPALFAAGVVTGFQGLVSHFNVDSRAGVLDHVLMGTELHRWHHAAGVQGNYAAVLSIWDRLFGTLVRRPGEFPPRLGVDRPQEHPESTDLAAVLAEPLQGPRAVRPEL